jgi:dTDP-L-rhamnose 4-epimerase
VADALLAAGYRVRALDELTPQVHGPDRKRPEYLHREVELIVGDVRDREAVLKALADVDAVFHFAARVGVGQSMYAMAEYASVNTVGTAVLLEAMVEKRIPRLLVASSMSIYGEGAYVDAEGHPVEASRSVEQVRTRDWDVRGRDGQRLHPVATPESKAPVLESVYALTKFDQERMCLMAGQAYGIDVTGLRFFNTYGSRQALSNPYTGVLAIFASRLMNGHRPLVFEDGEQLRDFVSVRDVARACLLALCSRAAAGRVFNVGSGAKRTVREVAERMARAVGKPELVPEITGSFRVGDVRHCYADISLAREHLGYQPEVDFDTGLRDLAEWLRGQVASDHVAAARAELESRGLAL